MFRTTVTLRALPAMAIVAAMALAGCADKNVPPVKATPAGNGAASGDVSTDSGPVNAVTPSKPGIENTAIAPVTAPPAGRVTATRAMANTAAATTRVQLMGGPSFRASDEQAALGRVATLVARESSPEEIFAL